MPGGEPPELLRPQSGARVADRRFSPRQEEFAVNVDRAVFTLAGTMVLVSVGLGWLVNPYWLLLAAFVGVNMLQAAFTGFCPAAMIFRKLGLKTGAAFECVSAAR